jgi:hypothetical protein
VGGRWRVVAAKYANRDAGLAVARTLRANGYPAEVVGPEGGIFFVHIPGLVGEAEARALMAGLRGIPGVAIPTIGEMPPKAR